MEGPPEKQSNWWIPLKGPKPQFPSHIPDQQAWFPFKGTFGFSLLTFVFLVPVLVFRFGGVLTLMLQDTREFVVGACRAKPLENEQLEVAQAGGGWRGAMPSS